MKLIKFFDYEMRDHPYPRTCRSLLAKDVYRSNSVGLKCAEAFIEILKIIKNN